MKTSVLDKAVVPDPPRPKVLAVPTVITHDPTMERIVREQELKSPLPNVTPRPVRREQPFDLD